MLIILRYMNLISNIQFNTPNNFVWFSRLECVFGMLFSLSLYISFRQKLFWTFTQWCFTHQSFGSFKLFDSITDYDLRSSVAVGWSFSSSSILVLIKLSMRIYLECTLRCWDFQPSPNVHVSYCVGNIFGLSFSPFLDFFYFFFFFWF